MLRTLTRLSAATALAASLLSAPAIAADRIKIGFVSTLSGPGAALGVDARDAMQLYLKLNGSKIGGLPAEMVVADDQVNPDVAKQAVDRMLKRDRVDIMTGIIFSNVLYAVGPSVFQNKTFYLSNNAGPNDWSGDKCNPYFYGVAWQSEDVPGASGRWVNDRGFKSVYLLAPNYPGGRENIAGFKRYFKGKIADEVYTKMGQLDFSAELAALRAAKPDATYFFYPGGMGIAFVRQYTAAGLAQQVPVFGPSFSLDQTILPAIGDAALGLYASTFWSEKLENPANAKFVADFEATHNRIPSPYAAQAYDTAQLIDAALKQAGGIGDKAKFRNALRAANFSSVRGPFRFNANHFPIQNYYLTQIQKDARGRLVNELRGVIFSSHSDAYAGQCRMKP